MAQAYLREGLREPAVFSLYFRKLPATAQLRARLRPRGRARLPRVVALRSCGPRRVGGLGGFRDDFLRWLESFRFGGSVWAMPEGTPVFPDEPLLEIEASLPEAQLVETLRDEPGPPPERARLEGGARGGGGRRPPGDRLRDAAHARARRRDERRCGRSTSRESTPPATSRPGSLRRPGHRHHGAQLRAGARRRGRRVSRDGRALSRDRAAGRHLRHARGRAQRDRARARSRLRLPRARHPSRLGRSRRSSRAARRALLDEAGLERVRIIASGGLDETEIATLVARGAPIDAFGVGTQMGASADAPTLDMAYKLTAYAGRGRLKLSPGKRMLPGRKQVFRRERTAGAAQRAGRRSRRSATSSPGPASRSRAAHCSVRSWWRASGRPPAASRSTTLGRAPATRSPACRRAVRALAPADPGYPVAISERLLPRGRRPGTGRHRPSTSGTESP